MRQYLKTWFTLITLVLVTAVLNGCGMEEEKKSGGTTPPGNTTPPGSTTPANNLGPLFSPAARILCLSQKYVGSANEAEIRGNLPGMTWEKGTLIGAPSNGYFSGQALAADVVGTFDFTYVAGSTWADFGKEENLKAMSTDDRSSIVCNWFDGTKVLELPQTTKGECHLRITVASDGKVTGAGNMRSFQ